MTKFTTLTHGDHAFGIACIAGLIYFSIVIHGGGANAIRVLAVIANGVGAALYAVNLTRTRLARARASRAEPGRELPRELIERRPLRQGATPAKLEPFPGGGYTTIVCGDRSLEQMAVKASLLSADLAEEVDDDEDGFTRVDEDGGPDVIDAGPPSEPAQELSQPLPPGPVFKLSPYQRLLDESRRRRHNAYWRDRAEKIGGVDTMLDIILSGADDEGKLRAEQVREAGAKLVGDLQQLTHDGVAPTVEQAITLGQIGGARAGVAMLTELTAKRIEVLTEQRDEMACRVVQLMGDRKPKDGPNFDIGEVRDLVEHVNEQIAEIRSKIEGNSEGINWHLLANYVELLANSVGLELEIIIGRPRLNG